MEITSILEIWRWFKWLPEFVLRKIFNKNRLSNLIYIDIRPRNESFRVQLSEVSSYTVYLQIINMSPFDVELDRAEINLNISGLVINHKHIKKYRLRAGQIGDLCISGGIDYSAASTIKKLKDQYKCSLSMYAVFKSSINEFEKDNIYLDGIDAIYSGSLLALEDKKIDINAG